MAGTATEAIRGLGPDVMRYLHSILRDAEMATDAFSQFAENLWVRLPVFRNEASLRGSAFRIAFNTALDIRDQTGTAADSRRVRRRRSRLR